MPATDRAFLTWLADTEARHQRALTSPEFLKAVRALSARYVERRAALPSRSPLDSAGKRAAFAAFYAPLHFLTTREVVRAIGAGRHLADRLVDLGCGTGAASAAWALEHTPHPTVLGIDTHTWALAEARLTWRRWGLQASARRADLVAFAERLAGRSSSDVRPLDVLAAWAVNELDEARRRRLLGALLDLARNGAAVLIIEPLSRKAAPWWDDWAAAFVAIGGRQDAWRFPAALPPDLARIDEAAGFRHDHLGARSIYCGEK
jgi:hypothetical protein